LTDFLLNNRGKKPAAACRAERFSPCAGLPAQAVTASAWLTIRSADFVGGFVRLTNCSANFAEAGDGCLFVPQILRRLVTAVFSFRKFCEGW